MSRQPGWYWVKHDGEWMAAYYGVLAWTWLYMDEDGFDGAELHEDEDVPFSAIGPRIPTPDEPWQCVPVEPPSELMRLMPEVLASLKGSGVDVSLADDVERALAAATPKPESQP